MQQQKMQKQMQREQALEAQRIETTMAQLNSQGAIEISEQMLLANTCYNLEWESRKMHRKDYLIQSYQQPTSPPKNFPKEGQTVVIKWLFDQEKQLFLALETQEYDKFINHQGFIYSTSVVNSSLTRCKGKLWLVFEKKPFPSENPIGVMKRDFKKLVWK